MSDVLIAVYATLKDRATREEALHEDVPVIGKATLDDYAETSELRDDDAYPTLVPRPRGRVPVELLRLTPHQLRRLDAWESQYSRIRVFRKSPVPTYTYVLRGRGGKEEETE